MTSKKEPAKSQPQSKKAKKLVNSAIYYQGKVYRPGDEVPDKDFPKTHIE